MRPTVAVSLLALALVAAGCRAGPPTPVAASGTAGTVETGFDEPAAAGLGDGLVVWESNRSGDWRLWTRGLDGGAPRMIGPDPGTGRPCCPHISPDGSRIAFLVLAGSRDEYPQHGASGTLWVMLADGSGARMLAESARTYHEHRAAVWRDDRELVYIGGDGRTMLLDVDGGKGRPLTRQQLPRHGFLVDATLGHATGGLPNFAPYDGDTQSIAHRATRGGCQPYFTHDGRWGFWTAGAGGPFKRIELATGATSIMLRKNDPRLPAGRGYLYFPMVSRDGRLFAFGASTGEHDQFRADYDIFIMRSDPRTLELSGRPVRMTEHPGTDRFPDVWAPPPAPGTEPPPAAPEPAPAPTASFSGWPTVADSLLFVWETGAAPNLVSEPASGVDVACTMTPRRRARLDHDFTMLPAGGAFLADEASAARVAAGCRDTNELSLQATLVPAPPGADDPGRILTLAARPGRPGLTLEQSGGDLVVRLRAFKPDRTPSPPVRVPLPSRHGAFHFALTYSPDQLRLYVDGDLQEIDTSDVRGDFYSWEQGPLIAGDTAQGGRAWRGRLEGIAVHARELAAETIRADYELYRARVTERAAVESLRVAARSEGCAPTPTLREISPYREALSVCIYRTEGGRPADRIAVARWSIMDGETLPTPSPRAAPETLRLEPFAENPQLESVFVSDTLSGAAGLPLYYLVD